MASSPTIPAEILATLAHEKIAVQMINQGASKIATMIGTDPADCDRRCKLSIIIFLTKKGILFMAQLLKVHGSFNHFFLLDQTTLPTPLSDPALIRLAQHLTDPGNGFLHGADGLLVVNRSEHPGVLGQMRVINADGSEASMCGNGLRTVARYLSEKTGQTNFKVETRQADLAVRKETDFATQVPAFAVEISPVRSMPLPCPLLIWA